MNILRRASLRNACSRPLRSLAPVGFGLFAVLAAASAWAQAPRDADAEKARKDAVENDFLQTKFDAAEQKLRAALAACGADGCSPGMKAKLFVALGHVLAAKKQLDESKDAFVEALRLDPKATPDPSLASTEASFSFDRAREELKIGEEQSRYQHTPPTEQQLRTPLPLWVDLAPEAADRVKSVTVTYQAPGSDEWKTLHFKLAKPAGWGVTIPCTDLGSEGVLRYHLVIAGENGVALRVLGSRARPIEIPIKKKIAGELPRWPGFAPPEACAAPTETKQVQCISDNECNTPLVCIASECRARPAPNKPKPPQGPPNNWLTVTFEPDIGLVSGTDVCTPSGQVEQHFVCQRADGSRYTGSPTLGVADDVAGGLALTTMRVALAYDRVFRKNVTFGLRVGAAFGGVNEGDASFQPLHLEGRVGYTLGDAPYEHRGARPFGFVSLGIAQVDAGVDLDVLEDASACGANPNDVTSPCTKPSADRVEPRRQTLTATHQGGPAFVGAGVGIGYAVDPRLGFSLALRFSATFPRTMAVLSPEAGFTFGF